MRSNEKKSRENQTYVFKIISDKVALLVFLVIFRILAGQTPLVHADRRFTLACMLLQLLYLSVIWDVI